jgi:hypothetical protein
MFSDFEARQTLWSLECRGVLDSRGRPRENLNRALEEARYWAVFVCYHRWTALFGSVQVAAGGGAGDLEIWSATNICF